MDVGDGASVPSQETIPPTTASLLGRKRFGKYVTSLAISKRKLEIFMFQH
jgi:hypothetical protein